MAPYARELTQLLQSWMELICYLYDGRMLALFRAGSDMMAEQRRAFRAGAAGSHRGQHRRTRLRHVDHLALQSRACCASSAATACAASRPAPLAIP